MSSYLTQIAARIVEQPQPIRPRLASLFEPVAGPRIRAFEAGRPGKSATGPRAAARAEQDPTSASVRRRQMKPPATEPVHVATQPPTRSSDDARPIAVIDPPAIDTQAEATDISVDATAIRVIDTPVVERSLVAPAHPAQPPPPAPDIQRQIPAREQMRTAMVAGPQIRELEHTLEEAESEWSGPEHGIEQPQIQPPESYRASVRVTPTVVIAPPQTVGIESPEPEALAPIRITIGRVDVRAVMDTPAPAPVARPAVPVSRALSLDDYLKQRNGASR